MFERFTDDARAIVISSQEHARRMGHNYIGCEHLLLSVAADAGPIGAILRRAGAPPQAVEAAIRQQVGAQLFKGVDRAALRAIGIDLDIVRDSVEAQLGPRRAPSPRRRWRVRRRACMPGDGHIPFTPRSKKCLELSLREAERLRDKNIGTEHIALALTRMTDGITPELFQSLGVASPALRADILHRHRRAG